MRSTQQTKRNVKYIAAGFSLLLLLMLAISGIGIWHTANIYRRLDSIVHQQNVKTELVSTMRYTARERLIVLHSLVITDDLFEMEDTALRFTRLAAEFNNSREQLIAMGLSPRELELLAEQARLTKTAGGLREEYVGLIAAGRRDEARTLLLRTYIPAQDRMLAVLEDLLNLQRSATDAAAHEAQQYYITTLWYLGGFGGAFLLIGFGTAYWVVRIVGRAEHAVFNEKELAQVTLHSIGDAVITTDADGLVDYANPVAEALTGWRTDQAHGRQLSAVLQLLDENTHTALDPLSDANDDVGPNRRAILRAGEREFAVESTRSPIRSFDGELLGHVIVFRDVSKAQFLAQQLSWQATHDALTALVNRREFERRLTQLLESAQRGGTHALLYLDLDQFKVVNDTCGHIAGDELLVQLAAVLKDRVRENDVVARLGGDEFGVLLENCPPEQALRIAEALRCGVQEFRFTWVDKSFELGVSVGVVPIADANEGMVRLLSIADAACYAAKDAGRNRVHFYQPNDNDVARRHGEMQWLGRIHQALEEGRFRLQYQIIQPLQAGVAAEHYEVLLTMIDQQAHVVPPMAFIPAAERYGLMPAIDRWVIHHLFSQESRRWQDARTRCGLNAACNVVFAINLSGTSLTDETFLDFVREQMAHYAVPPQMLCFEITETAAITNLYKASQFMRELRRLGCRFALDDFGKGMSSFAYLKNLPVDYLKIDGAFVRDIADDPVDYAMVEAIVRIGRVLGIRTIAESVETPAVLEKLRKLGVDYAQGYTVHRPQPFTADVDMPRITA